MVEVAHLTSQHQSLAKAEVITPLQEDLNVLTAGKCIMEMFAQQGDLFVMDATKGDTSRQCAIHPGRFHSHDHPHKLNLRLYKRYRPKVTRTLVKQKMLT